MPLVKRKYNCDEGCKFSPIPVTKLFERRVVNNHLYDQAYNEAYATPAERQRLNDLADESHEVAHTLFALHVTYRMKELGGHADYWLNPETDRLIDIWRQAQEGQE